LVAAERSEAALGFPCPPWFEISFLPSITEITEDPENAWTHAGTRGSDPHIPQTAGIARGTHPTDSFFRLLSFLSAIPKSVRPGLYSPLFRSGSGV